MPFNTLRKYIQHTLSASTPQGLRARDRRGLDVDLGRIGYEERESNKKNDNNVVRGMFDVFFMGEGLYMSLRRHYFGWPLLSPTKVPWRGNFRTRFWRKEHMSSRFHATRNAKGWPSDAQAGLA